ncbi:MAG: hypothetical protein VX689_00480, partial [Bacteroidota bacterium]|nr:hypothetical protein [Bacteroidota bacterium]
MSTVELLKNNIKIKQSKIAKKLRVPPKSKGNRKMYIESYGCQMNLSDSEIITSILAKEGFSKTNDITIADLVFVNTCSIREKA